MVSSIWNPDIVMYLSNTFLKWDTLRVPKMVINFSSSVPHFSSPAWNKAYKKNSTSKLFSHLISRFLITHVLFSLNINLPDSYLYFNSNISYSETQFTKFGATSKLTTELCRRKLKGQNSKAGQQCSVKCFQSVYHDLQSFKSKDMCGGESWLPHCSHTTHSQTRKGSVTCVMLAL